MFASLLEAVAGWIVSFISTTGYIGVVALMAVESACIPLPSEIIMPFAGYLVSTGRFSLAATATAGAIGCNIGSALAYWAGRWGGRPFLDHWGKWVLLRRDDLNRSERFFARFGTPTVFFGRLLPVVRTFIALPAGLARMPQWKFHLYTFVGSWLWCYALAYAGMVLGDHWNSDPRLQGILHGADFAIIAIVAVGFAALWWHRRKA